MRSSNTPYPASQMHLQWARMDGQQQQQRQHHHHHHPQKGRPHPDFPMLPADTRTDGHGNPVYHPGMWLPRPADRRGILEFLGVDEPMRASVLAHPSEAGGGGGGGGCCDPAASAPDATLQALVDSYAARGRPGGPPLPPAPASQENREAYQGLMPSFAGGLGRVQIVASWRGEPGESTQQYFSSKFRTSPRDDADSVVRQNAELLRHLWKQQNRAH